MDAYELIEKLRELGEEDAADAAEEALNSENLVAALTPHPSSFVFHLTEEPQSIQTPLAGEQDLSASGIAGIPVKASVRTKAPAPEGASMELIRTLGLNAQRALWNTFYGGLQAELAHHATGNPRVPLQEIVNQLHYPADRED